MCLPTNFSENTAHICDCEGVFRAISGVKLSAHIACSDVHLRYILRQAAGEETSVVLCLFLKERSGLESVLWNRDAGRGKFSYSRRTMARERMRWGSLGLCKTFYPESRTKLMLFVQICSPIISPKLDIQVGDTRLGTTTNSNIHKSVLEGFHV